MFLQSKWRQEKRKAVKESVVKSALRRFNDAEKCDLVDIICNEETTNADGDQDEPVLVKLRSKTVSNKEKTSLYRSVAEQLTGRGYEIRSPE